MTKKKSPVKIDKERCKGCSLCIEVCPQGVLGLSDEVNRKGHRFIVVKHPEKCIRCGLCFIMCPYCSIEILEEE